MRIAYLAYTDLKRQGAPKIHVSAIVEGLADLGHKITLVVPAGFGGIEHRNVRVVEIAQKPMISILWARKVAKWLYDNAGELDVVYERDFYNSASIARNTVRANIPFVLEMNGSLKAEKSVSSEKSRYKLWNSLDLHFSVKKRLKLADRVICVAPGLIEEYAPMTGDREKFVFHPNGVDTEIFCPVENKDVLREKIELSLFKPLLGAVGSILPYHVDSPVIPAMEILAERYPQIGLVFVGGGPGKENLMAVAKASSVRDKIHFRGPVSTEESAKYIAALDVALAWSTEETAVGTWPVRLSAYSSCGIPIVGPNWGTYLTFESAGVLKASAGANPKSIADAVSEIIENPEIYAEMSRAGRKFAVENLSWKSIVDKTEKLLYGVVNNSKN